MFDDNFVIICFLVAAEHSFGDKSINHNVISAQFVQVYIIYTSAS